MALIRVICVEDRRRSFVLETMFIEPVILTGIKSGLDVPWLLVSCAGILFAEQNKSLTFALIYGARTGTTSFILGSPLISLEYTGCDRYPKGMTTKFNMCDLNQVSQLPFVSPYIGPMTQIIEKAKVFLPRNIDTDFNPFPV